MTIPNGRWRVISTNSPSFNGPAITNLVPALNEAGFTLYVLALANGQNLLFTKPSGVQLSIPSFIANVQPLYDERTGQILTNERNGQILLGSPGPGFGYYTGNNAIVGGSFCAYVADAGILTEVGQWSVAFAGSPQARSFFNVGVP